MSTPFLLARRLVNARAVTPFIARNFSVTAPAKAGGYWNKDWRPTDDPPATEEEKRAAAKKYGMIPEDYEAYAADGFGYGDYPKLPLVSAESRDPSATYDFPELKRNFGEPMNVDFDLVGEDRWDANRRLYVPFWEMCLWFFGTMGGAALLFHLGQYVRVIPTPMMPRQMGTDGKTHYTFDLEEDC